MIKGTAWADVQVWHDDDEPTEYRVKVAYEYEYISNDDPYYQEIYEKVEVIEWPEGINETTKKMINNKLGDVLADILENDDCEPYEISFEND